MAIVAKDKYCPRGCTAGRSRAILVKQLDEVKCLYCGWVMYAQENTLSLVKWVATRGRITNSRDYVYPTGEAFTPHSGTRL